VIENVIPRKRSVASYVYAVADRKCSNQESDIREKCLFWKCEQGNHRRRRTLLVNLSCLINHFL